MSGDGARLWAQFLSACRGQTYQPELLGGDGSRLRIQWSPEPGVQVRAFLTQPNAPERPYATIYDAQTLRPHDYPADFPFITDRTVILAHDAGPNQTTAGYWPAPGQTADVVEQLIALSVHAGWTRGGVSTRPSIGTAVVHSAELRRGPKRRIVMALSGNGSDEEMVGLIDISPAP